MWQIIGVVLVAWLVWKALSLGLRLIGWGLIVLGLLNIGNASEAMGTVVTVGLGLVCLAAGHAVFYLRRGHWKPQLVENLVGRRLNAGAQVAAAVQAPLRPSRHHYRARRPSRHHSGQGGRSEGV